MAYLLDAVPMYFLKKSAAPTNARMIRRRTTTAATIKMTEWLRDLFFIGSLGSPDPRFKGEFELIYIYIYIC